MRHRPLAAALLVLVIFGTSAHAQSLRDLSVPAIEYETFTLDNGLKFIVHEDHSAPLVAVEVWYDVGSAIEPANRTGFAHLFEHMMFQETAALDKGEIMDLISAAGGRFNGSTTQDRTNYYETLPSNRLNLALWIHSQQMGLLRVTEQNFEREREVVKEERRSAFNRPYTEALLVTLDTLAMNWGPYEHWVIGSMEDLNAATAVDVREFHETYYAPNNAAITVVGDVTVERVRELAEEYFGWIPRSAVPIDLPPIPDVPRTDGPRRVTVVDSVANTPAYMMAFNIPPHDHPDTPELQLLASIFSEGESSRLYQRLVKEEEAALFVNSGLQSRMGPGLFRFFALPNRGVEIERIEELIRDEIQQLRTEGVIERELQKAKNQMIADRIRSRQTASGKVSLLQHYRFYHDDLSEINTEVQEFLAVTTEDIRRVAREYLVPGNRTTVIVVPPAETTAAASGANSATNEGR